MPRSPGLFQWVATDSRKGLGSINVILDDEGTCDLFFMHTLAGDTLDPGELKHAAFVVAVVANQLDDEVQKKFGGKRWPEIKSGALIYFRASKSSTSCIADQTSIKGLANP